MSERMGGEMRYLSVCSGIEAATVAWHSLGWKPVAFSEVDAFPSAVLAHHYPDVPNWGDMTKFQEWPDACVCLQLGSGRPNANTSMATTAASLSDVERSQYIGDGKRSNHSSDGSGHGKKCATCGGTTIDVLVGGTPCQSFSVAGLRKGLADPRGNLMLTYLAIADRYRPEWVVWENVPGVLSSNGGRDFGTFLGGLGLIGYGFAYRVLDAQYFGLAQRRRRVFVVGCLGNWRRAAAVLFERASLSGHPAPSREAGEGSACDAAPSLTASGRGVERTGESRGQDPVVAVARCVTTREGNRQDYETTALVAHSLRGDGFDASEDGTGTPLVPVVASTRKASHDRHRADVEQTLIPALSFKSGQSEAAGGTFVTEEVAPTLQAANNGSTAVPAVAFHNRQDPDVSGDLTHPLGAKDNGMAVGVSLRGRDGGATAELGDEVGNALRASGGDGDKAHVLASMQVRRLTPRECERLQGFPDDFTLIPHRGRLAADGPRYKALGNSMAVPVMAWIGRRVAAVAAIERQEVAA